MWDWRPEPAWLISDMRLSASTAGASAEWSRSTKRPGAVSLQPVLGNTGHGAKATFIAVGTPSLAEVGSADVHYVMTPRAVAEVNEEFAVVVVKSTVPIGAGDQVEHVIAERLPSDRFAVVSSPEFLREGAAIEDFKKPARVVIGVEDERAREVMRGVCQPISPGRHRPALAVGFVGRTGIY